MNTPLHASLLPRSREGVVKLGASVNISRTNVTLENVSMTHPVHLG